MINNLSKGQSVVYKYLGHVNYYEQDMIFYLKVIRKSLTKDCSDGQGCIPNVKPSVER